jgi:hypothetical protein
MNSYKYTCIYCHYETNNGQAWYQHKKSQKHLKNVKIAEEINDTSEKSLTKPSKSLTQLKGKKVSTYICKFCKKVFTRKDNLTVHLTNRCKEKKKLEEEKNKQEEEKKKLEEEKNKQEEEKKKLEEQREKRKLEEKRKIEEEEKQKLEEEKRKIEEEEKQKLEEEKRKLEEEKKKFELDNQKLMIQFMEKQAEEQRKLMEMFILSQNNNTNNIKEEIMGEIKEILDQKLNAGESNINNSENHHNHNSGTIFEAKHQNNLLNNLNLNYTNVISMEKFLYNMEHVNKISKSDLEAIAYASEHMKEDDLAETLHRTIMKNCEEQTKGKINEEDGLELIPVLPVVCSDGNCRSHKEKVKKFWETVYANNDFVKMLNIIDKRLYEVLQKKIYLEENSKKKLFNKIKRKYTIHDMESMQQKINGDKKGKNFKSTI